MADVELLPCPFCGTQPKHGDAVPSTPGMEDCGYFYIECCDIHLHREETEDAIAAWNTRANLAPLQAENERLRAELDRAIAELAGPEPTDGSAYYWACRVNGARRKAEARAEQLAEALRIAEAALADIGDADREPGDDLAWCEARAAKALPAVRAALAQEDRNG